MGAEILHLAFSSFSSNLSSVFRSCTTQKQRLQCSTTVPAPSSVHSSAPSTVQNPAPSFSSCKSSRVRICSDSTVRIRHLSSPLPFAPLLPCFRYCFHRSGSSPAPFSLSYVKYSFAVHLTPGTVSVSIKRKQHSPQQCYKLIPLSRCLNTPRPFPIHQRHRIRDKNK